MKLCALTLLLLACWPAFGEEGATGANSSLVPTTTASVPIDPTKNVTDLVKAEAKRLDDMRTAETIRVNESIAAAKAERELRAEYDEKLRQAEAKRIDAIRSVDVNAVSVASQRTADQASVLATQVSQSAEALRALVAATATTVASSQQQLANTLTARITALEQAQYEGKGKQSFQDPQLTQLIEQVRTLQAGNEKNSGRDAGSSSATGYIFGGVSLLVSLLMVVFSYRRDRSANG